MNTSTNPTKIIRTLVKLVKPFQNRTNPRDLKEILLTFLGIQFDLIRSFRHLSKYDSYSIQV